MEIEVIIDYLYIKEKGTSHVISVPSSSSELEIFSFKKENENLEVETFVFEDTNLKLKKEARSVTVVNEANESKFFYSTT